MQDGDKTVIRIKSNNSLLNMSILLVVLLAAFTATVILFNLLGFVFSRGVMAVILGYTMAGISIVFKWLAAFIITRAALWTLFGSETITIDKEKLVYARKIAGIGYEKQALLGGINGIKMTSYAPEKDIQYMLKSEAELNKGCFEAGTQSGIIKIGVFLSFDEADYLEKLFKASGLS